MEAAEAARAGAGLEEIVRLLRTLIPRVYLVFFVENLEHLYRGGRLNIAQTMVASVLNLKPLLGIEEGELVLLEKVRTRQRALEKLSEFVLEFNRVHKLTVVHSGNSSEVSELVARIQEDMPNQQIDVARYGPALATHVGPDAIGVVVYEGP